MSRRQAFRALPLLLIAALLLALSAAALTESEIEADVKDAVGLVSRCVPDEASSDGWRNEPDLPDARDELRAVAVDGQIYLAGGQSELLEFGGPSDIPGVEEHVEVRLVEALTSFAPSTGTYTELAQMPVPVNHHELVTYRGDVYSIGGHGRLLFGGSPKRAFQRYEPESNEWTMMPPMPTGRGAAGAGVIGDLLYVVGGQSENGKILSSMDIFDFRTGKWRAGPDMPTAREHVGATVADGQLYVLGGRDLHSDALGAAERYDPTTEEWEVLERLPVPSGGLDGVTLEETVLAVGGGNDRAGTVTPAVQQFQPDTGGWSEQPRMPTARHGFAAAVVNDRLYVFGGSPCAGFSVTATADSFELPAASAS